MKGEGGGGRGRRDWVSRQPLFVGAENKIIETIVNITEAIKANTLNRYLIVIFTLWQY